MYPTNPTELAAFIAALVPLAIWAASGLVTGVNALHTAHRAGWDRLHDVADILYNKGNTYGAWRQMVAIWELKGHWFHRTQIRELAQAVRTYLGQQPNVNQEVLTEIDKLVKAKGG